jgi:hypothetical protein
VVVTVLRKELPYASRDQAFVSSRGKGEVTPGAERYCSSETSSWELPLVLKLQYFSVPLEMSSRATAVWKGTVSAVSGHVSV